MFDVAVFGGGLVGSAFALKLAETRPELKITIIERVAPNFADNQLGFDSRIYAITPKNYQKLLDLGIEIDYERVCNISTMNVRGDDNSSIVFDQTEINNPFLAKIIESSNLHKAIHQKLSKCLNVEFKYVQTKDIVNLPDRIEIVANDGEIIQSKLLVAADGANSFVRSKFGFATENIPYFQSGVVANFKCEFEHHGTAHQWFSGESVLAYLPLPDNCISIVWSTNNPKALLEMSKEEFCRQVELAGNNTLGNFELISKPLAFPLQLNLVDRFFNNRVILIGDAAHTIHPLAGQGVNLGFGDAWELVKTISGTDLSIVNNMSFVRFNYSRMLEVRKMQITCHGLHRLFHNQTSSISKLRNFGLNLVNNSQILKKTLINSAINY